MINHWLAEINRRQEEVEAANKSLSEEAKKTEEKEWELDL